jgi:hypothetical protein
MLTKLKECHLHIRYKMALKTAVISLYFVHTYIFVYRSLFIIMNYSRWSIKGEGQPTVCTQALHLILIDQTWVIGHVSPCMMLRYRSNLSSDNKDDFPCFVKIWLTIQNLCTTSTLRMQPICNLTVYTGVHILWVLQFLPLTPDSTTVQYERYDLTELLHSFLLNA